MNENKAIRFLRYVTEDGYNKNEAYRRAWWKREEGYQIAVGGTLICAIPAVISEENFVQLTEDYPDMEMPDMSGIDRMMREYKGEDFHQIEVPKLRELREHTKMLKEQKRINFPFGLDNGMSVVWYCNHPCINLGAGKPVMRMDQLIKVFDLIRNPVVYAGKRNVPIHVTDGEAHFLVCPMIPKDFDNAMAAGEVIVKPKITYLWGHDPHGN